MLSTSSGTMAVNAAFLQEIKEDHRLLHEYLERTQALLARPSFVLAEPALLADLMGSVRDQLAIHFALEEAYGYFEEAVGVAPRLSQRAAVLVAQHGPLYREAAALADRAEDLRRPGNRHARSIEDISQAFHCFLKAFHEHEENENALIQDAFESDLGTGD